MINQSIKSSRDRLDTLILAHKTHTSMENHIWDKLSIHDLMIYLKDEFSLTSQDKSIMEEIEMLDKVIEKERIFFEYLYEQCFPDYHTDR